MDKEYIRQHLPEEPPEGLLEWVLQNESAELGPEYIVFHSEQVPVMPSLCEIMEYNDIRPRRHVWAAFCTCTACGDDFITQKVPGADAINIATGDDGVPYTLDPGEPIEPWFSVETAYDGEMFNCPICFRKATLVHSRKVRGGRTKRLLVLSVQNVEGYTAIMYWYAWRKIDEFGCTWTGTDPVAAYVLTESGTLVRYAHRVIYGVFRPSAPLSGWKIMGTNDDVIDVPYADWGSICSRKSGAAIYNVYPDLEGTTGEKTGLTEYLRADGYRPVRYLKLWRKHRCIENLCKVGQANLVADIVSQSYRFSCPAATEAAKYVDLSKRKPHEMLRMTKSEFRNLRQQGISLSLDDMRYWTEYESLNGSLSFGAYVDQARRFGAAGLKSALDIMRLYADTDLDKLSRYLEKQGLRPGEAGLLLDTRNAARKLYGARELTFEEMWPRHLQDAHDRINRMLIEKQSREKADKLRTEFENVRLRYRDLEWTDGELCVILPKDNGELVREGKVLRHCVGGFGDVHVKGSSVIFFVRHYRRPERPYYTLAINMTDIPVENQLHGYGNERHGDHKQYTHSIPKKVRDFCDRWEREVLMTWYLENQKKTEVKTA